MKSIELYHLRNNPSVMVPRVFLSASEMPHMKVSTVRIVRTIEREFHLLCQQLHECEAKVVIQELPDQIPWKVHVIRGGMVGTSTTERRTLVDAVRHAWTQHNAKLPEVVQPGAQPAAV